MQSIRRRLSTLCLAVGFGIASLASVGTANAAWTPKKPVEFIIMAGTGGGADQIARLLQGLIEKKKLSPQPFIPINKPGGSGAEALRYLKDKAGDDHTVLVTLNSFYTTPIIQKDLGVDISTFTPIGRMALDTFLLWVNSEQKDIKDLDSYVKAVKAAGKKMESRRHRFGPGGLHPDGHDGEGIWLRSDLHSVPRWRYGAKNLVGKHIDSTVNNPAEQNEFMRAGKTKPLVQFTPERMAAYPDVPTAKELGHDIVYFMQRSINGLQNVEGSPGVVHQPVQDTV